MLRFLTAVLLYIGASTSAVSAGLVSKFVPDTDKKLPFSAHAARNLKKAAIHTATSTAANGGKVARNALSAVTGAMVDAGAATFLGNLGDRYDRGSLNYAQHKLAHFVVGFCAHELKGEDGLSGGLGAVIGEIVAEHLQREALESTFREAERYGLSDEERLELYLKNIENSEKLGRLAAAGTAFIGRLEITTADSAAQTAIEENSLPHLIAGGAIMSYLAYDYFQVLYTEGWDGLFARIQQEYAESLSVGPNPTVVATAYLAMKWEHITARFMASPLGRFVEAKLIKPGTKTFDDFVQFLVSKTPVFHPAFVGTSNATISSKDLQQSFTLFSKKLSQNAAKSKTVIPERVVDTQIGRDLFVKGKVQIGKFR